jgi:prophage antirepressor-like protein
MTSLIDNIDMNLSFNENTVRVFGTLEEPLFVLKDICKILGLSNPSKTLESIDKDYHLSLEVRGGNSTGIQQTLVVKEAGLYQVIMRCRKPIAKPFQKWVCGEVLPSLRKKGEYKMNEDYQLKLKQLEQEKLNLEEENKMLVENHIENSTKIKHLQNKVLLKQKRKVYDDKNFIYILQDEHHKKDGIYVIGKAINLTSRLTSYEKSHDVQIVYYRTCNSSQQMGLIENCVLFKLDKYREVSNRDRFVLPEGKDISLFTDAIDVFVNAFKDVDASVDIEKDLTDEELTIKKQEQYAEYYEDNKDLIAYKDKIYRENNKEKIDEYQTQYKLENKDAINLRSKKYYEDNKEIFAEYNKEYKENHKEEIQEISKEYYQENKEEMKQYKKEYYQKNKEESLELAKKYYEEHKEEVLEKTKERYANNKEKILAYQTEKIECECGIKLQRNYMAKHKKTEIHKISLESKLKGENVEKNDSIKCECGHSIKIGYTKRHLNSKIHAIALKKITETT